MDSFKFNNLNYQDTNSLVDAQNKIIDALTKDKKTLLQDEGNYAAFREKEKARQIQQLGNIIAGVPKLKKALDAAEAAKDAKKEQDKYEDDKNKNLKPSDYVNELSDKFSYITGVQLHDENLNVVMRVNLAQPVIKRVGDRLVVRARLDF